LLYVCHDATTAFLLVCFRATAAEAACGEASAAECAHAWEEVLELRAAQAEEAAAASAPPTTPPAPTFAGKQARGVPDPLGGVRPSQVVGTQGPPSGSLRAAGRLERMARASGADAPPEAVREAARARVPAVQRALEASVAEAVQACEGGTSADCAVAWDAVEELSATVDKAERKQGEQQQG
jgi:hypothetical protein